MPTRMFRAVLGLAALALVAAACSTASMDHLAGKNAEPTQPPVGMAPAASPLPDKDRAPVADVLRFSAPRLGGGRVVGAEYAGQDLALWFWAPW